MKILLDTHILIWFLTDETKLIKEQIQILENSTHQKYISIVTLWEIAIKSSLGKLEIDIPLDKMIPKEVILLEIKVEHLKTLQTLPFYHKDPFDRIIISQAITEKFLVMSEDGNFPYYDIKLI